MTLLEVVVSFVLLAVVGVACLELSRSATELERRSVEWAQAVAEGEAALTSAVADGSSSLPMGSAIGSRRSATSRGSGSARPVVVTREPWSAEADVDLITVDVSVSAGKTFRISKLVRASRASRRTSDNSGFAP